MVQIPSAGMSQIYITSCMQLSVPDSCISSIKVHMIERLQTIQKALKNVVTDLSSKLRVADQLANAQQQADQAREDPSHDRDANRDRDLGMDNR